jgi:Tol biopolymer transport system component
LTIRSLKYFFIILLVCLSAQAHSQFYNGHQMDFGKNRVQYEEFEWFFLRFQKFDTYFYAGGKPIAMQAAEIAYEEMESIAKQLDYQLDKRLIFVIYHNLSDFRQSNIGLQTMNNQYNIGGATQIIDNVVFMYVEGDQAKLRTQIRKSIAEITVNEFMYGSDWKNKAANNTLLSLPEWYTQGLISYLTYGWNEDIENRVKDGIIHGYYEKINRLDGENATYAGHSIWYYITNTYGKQVIPTILYLTRISKNVENGFLYVLGTNIKSLSYSWLDYYDKLYYEHYKNAENPESQNLFFKSRKQQVISDISIHPNGNYFAYTTNILGKMKIFIHDIDNDKRKKVLRQGHKLDQITDFSYPVLNWHPSGKLLAYITEKKGKIYYCTYHIDDKEFRKFELRGFDKVLDFDFSDDGLDIVFNGFRNGQSDIFIYNPASNTYRNLTADLADDYHPVFIKNSRQILFSSRRAVASFEDSDDQQIPVQENRDIFIYDLNNSEATLTQLTNTPTIDERQAYISDDGFFIFLNNENGIFNRHKASYDSTISHIDTITHYRYYMNSSPITNYKSNILQHNISNQSESGLELMFNENTYQIYRVDCSNSNPIHNTTSSAYRRIYEQNYEAGQETKGERTEIIKAVEQKKDSLININNYEFSPELINQEKKETDFDENGEIKTKPVNRYMTSFYTARIVNQVDFGFLNASYQRFTGSAFYFNPGFNILLTIEAMDLFQDYRLTGGFRFAGNFDSNEYLFSFENLKGRWNKQFIFHRLAITDFSGYTVYKTYLHQGVYRMRYPFNQVSAVQGNIGIRQDKISFLSTDFQNLLRENDYDYWANLKLEYVFSNTRNLMINIQEGARFKIFGEFYKQLDEKASELFVVGADFRYYVPIHRNIILASRFAASNSFGSSKLIYYLGGIDNWINLNSERPMFDRSTRINPNENYAYQAVATNMRGFTQNIRNGNSFAVLNTEIRWPIISYLLNRPVNSELLNSFQLIGFVDIGSAWTGLNPFSGENAYENDIYENGSVTIIIDQNSYPIVAGYGVGVRTKLLGYFVRFDYARGIEDNVLLPGMFYLSLNLDF